MVDCCLAYEAITYLHHGVAWHATPAGTQAHEGNGKGAKRQDAAASYEHVTSTSKDLF
jgi:hypothetical protein